MVLALLGDSTTTSRTPPLRVLAVVPVAIRSRSPCCSGTSSRLVPALRAARMVLLWWPPPPRPTRFVRVTASPGAGCHSRASAPCGIRSDPSPPWLSASPAGPGVRRLGKLAGRRLGGRRADHVGQPGTPPQADDPHRRTAGPRADERAGQPDRGAPSGQGFV